MKDLEKLFFQAFLLSKQVRGHDSFFEKEVVEVPARESALHGDLERAILTGYGCCTPKFFEELVKILCVSKDFYRFGVGADAIHWAGMNEISSSQHAEVRADLLNFVE